MPGHVALSYATLNASLALVLEALNGSGEPDRSAAQLVERTPQALSDELLYPPNPSPVIWLRSTAHAAKRKLPQAKPMATCSERLTFVSNISRS